jgi:hypothetical protein
MRLIGEPADCGDAGQGFVTEHHFLGMLDFPVKNVGIRRLAEIASEGSRKLPRAQTGERGKILYPDRAP